MTTFEGFAAMEREGWHDDAVAAGYVELFSSACDIAILGSKCRQIRTATSS